MAISDDLNSIRTHLEDDYKELENLGVSVEDRNIENIKDMANQIYAKFPKTSYGEGTSITLSNCLKGKLDYEDDKVGYGDTKQEGEPTPTTPIPIQVVTGEQEVVVRGKNILNINGTHYYRYSDISIQNNTISMTDTSTTAGNWVWWNLPVKSGQQITISYGDITNEGSVSLNNRVHYMFTEAPYTSYSSDFANSSYINKADKYATTTTTNICLVLLLRTGNGNSYDINNIQVEYSSSATPYEPYITPITKQLSLGDRELYKNSTIVRVSEGNWKFIDNWGKVNANDYSFSIGSITIDGQTYNQFSTPSNTPTSLKGGLNTSDKVKCNKFLSGISAINKFYINSGRRIVVVAPILNGNYVTDIDTFNTIKSDMYIVGELNTPIETPITDTTLINQLEEIYNIQSVNGTTIIETNGNLPMIIKCRALKGE